MSFFTFDEKQAGNGFELLPAGEYEVYITEFKKHNFERSGADGFKAVYTIRTDVDQQGGKRKLFDNYVMTEAAAFKFHQLFKALNLPNGASFATPEAMMQAVINQPIRVKLTIRKYNNEDQNNVAAVMASKVGGGPASSGNDPFSDDGRPIDISEDDLPF